MYGNACTYFIEATQHTGESNAQMMKCHEKENKEPKMVNDKARNMKLLDYRILWIKKIIQLFIRLEKKKCSS